MTRLWAPSIKDIQKAIVAAILTERDANAASLPSEMQGQDLEISVGVGSENESQLPFSIRVLPPEDSTTTPEVSNMLEGNLEFPCLLKATALQQLDMTEALVELQGLVIDAIQADPTLGGLCAGPDAPAHRLSVIKTSGGQVDQEIAVRLIVRN